MIGDGTKSRGAGGVNAAAIPRLLPREHGAYAQIIFPLLTALALGDRNASELLWVAAAAALFVVHEPLLILAGERGRRIQAQLGVRARTFATVLIFAAAAAGIMGWWLAPQRARLAALLPFALGVLLLSLIIAHKEKTLAGELLAALTFSTMLLPVALAGGVHWRAAAIACAVWAIIFVLGILMIRAVIANAKKPAPARAPLYASLAVNSAAVVSAVALLPGETVPTLAAAAVLPAALITLACNLAAIHPRHLREIGWSLVASNLIALAAIVTALR